jgi:hypothetical protein
MVKYVKKVITHVITVAFYGINMKKPIQNLFNFHYETMVHSIEFMVSYT